MTKSLLTSHINNRPNINIQGHKFVVGALPYGVFVYVQPDTRYYGLEIIIADAIANKKNFR